MTNLFDDSQKKVLHVAPSKSLRPLFEQKLGEGYITADLYRKDVTVKMDITDIQYDDNAFDIIICSHVLEHVFDDKKAIREFYRVLKPGGEAFIMVPITVEKTFEDASVTTPSERLKYLAKKTTCADIEMIS
ncbi:MAG: class I SAM-dependent methyltransferase [Candidatus Dadabacteria bacterium]|nr:class I SAM-dependent methyltransferase [Candidatus Dadabacteria bacterium]NIS09126.1 class I SAM-dependent methyltransferase [Candidatus Dadabacteria bacterium]NIV41559.1 methyltransferase domain-containing protein [Candidatus Dadabacteria bacterium]NIX15703.1 methyltransferase domain-containing protein [Candidatus Dadabacteria bacterium]NIY22434.1 methyltransferase domain-containing protein [Candidatus Dadabacteria bacterium]